MSAVQAGTPKSASDRAGEALRRDLRASRLCGSWNAIARDAAASGTARAMRGLARVSARAVSGSRVLAWFIGTRESEGDYRDTSRTARRVLRARDTFASKLGATSVVTRALPGGVVALLYASAFLIALVPFQRDIGPIPVASDFVLLSALIAAWLVDVAIRPRFRPARTPFDIFFVLYILIAVISMIGAASVLPAARALFRQLSYFLLFYVVVDTMRDRHHIERLLTVVIAGGAIVSLYGLFQYLHGIPEQIGVAGQNLAESVKGRVYSTQGNPNFLSEYLILLMPVGLAMAMRARSLAARLFHLGSVALMGLALLLTYTRAGWVGAGLSLIVFFALYDWRYLGMLAGAGAAAVAVLPGVIQRLASIVHFASGSGGFRLQLFRTAASMVADRPAFGVGIGNYLDAYPRFVARYPTYDVGFTQYSSHNSFLTVAAEMGIAGLIIFVVIVLHALRQAFSGWVHLASREGRIISLGIGCGMIALLTQSFSNIAFFHPRVIVYFWLLLAVLVALSRVDGDGRHPAADAADPGATPR